MVGSGSSSLRARINAWNQILIETAENFREKYTDVQVRIFDFSAPFMKVLDDPKKYGFKDNTTMFIRSMAEMEECIWYDELHPTTGMHKIVAAELAKFLTEEAPKDKTAEK